MQINLADIVLIYCSNDVANCKESKAVKVYNYRQLTRLHADHHLLPSTQTPILFVGCLLVTVNFATGVDYK